MTGQVWDLDPATVDRHYKLMMQPPFVSACLMTDYQALPETVKSIITYKEYHGMGHEQRASLVEDMTTPDEPEDE